MTRIAVTGARGYLGRHLVAGLAGAGIEAIGLARRGEPAWELGQPLPESCAGASAVIHLASAALVEKRGVEAAARLDVRGTSLILDQVRGWRAAGATCRFVFVSSQSARRHAANAYGRSKFAIENLLERPDEIVARPGLVYGTPPASVYAMFETVARLPLVPAVGARRNIQPIAVEDLVACIVQIATMASPPAILNLGAPQALSFAEAIRATARRTGRREPLFVPCPVSPVRAAARCLDRMLGLTLTERIDGLVALEPFETAPSLAALGRTLAPFSR